ncbi:unnamed protein product, partial [Adineta steineri]
MFSALTDRFSIARSLDNLVPSRRLTCTSTVTDSPINSSNINNRKTKSNGNDLCQQAKSCQNMKCIVSSKQTLIPVTTKRTTPDYSDMERNNIYAETPPKTKPPPTSSVSPPTLVNGTNHYMPILQQKRPTNNATRNMNMTSNSSMSSFSTVTSSSQSTTPSNSFRNDATSIMTRSADASSSCGLIMQTKNGTNNIKSKSTYDIDSSIIDRSRQQVKENLNNNNNNNSKCLNTITNGNFVPLQSVKEDECLEVNNDREKKCSKNGDEQQRMLIDILKQKYPRQHVSSSSSSAVSTPMMPRTNSPHQRSSSTDPTDEELTTNVTNGFIRGQRNRSSLPFIIKPATNMAKTNSLGLCFLICGGETKKVLLPSYISCIDTLKALFVRAFPQHLTMKHMDTDDVRIYIREPDKDIFYQLEDMSDVKDRAVLKVVHFINTTTNNNNNHNTKPQVSFKEPELDEVSVYVPFTSRPTLASEITYQRLSRLGRVPSTTSVVPTSRNGSMDDKSISSVSANSQMSSSSSSSRSLSEPRRRINNNETTAITHNNPTYANPSTLAPKGILSSPRSGSTTPTTSRFHDDDSQNKMMWMEKQLESLTELVKELTRERALNEHQLLTRTGIYKGILSIDYWKKKVLNNNVNINYKSLRQQLYELKLKTHTLRSDLVSVRRMQQSLQVNFKTELQDANKKIENQIYRLHQMEIRSVQCRTIENELDLYVINSTKIDRDLEDLEASVEELQNDVKSKHCYVTMNDVESFALVLSTISRSLVDLKASFPVLREKICSLGPQSTLNDDQKFLHEEPERLDYTIKKCKRLTTMLYQLKRLAVSQEQKIVPTKTQRRFSLGSNGKSVDRKRLLEQIESITQNSDGRIKAIEKAEKLRDRRLNYANQLDTLKQMKYTAEQTNGHDLGQCFDTRSLTNSILLSSSTRTSICSTQSTTDSTPLSNNCPSPSLSFIVRHALISPTNPTSMTNDIKMRSHSLIKPPSKVTFSQQLITNGKSSISSRDHSTDSCLSTNGISINKKGKPTPPPRVQSTSSSAVSSAASCSSSSSSSTSSNGSANSRSTNGYCGIIPLVISPDRRHSGRCNSFSSSSTDTDSVISNPRGTISHKSPTVLNTKPILLSNGFHHKTATTPATNPTTLMRASVTDFSKKDFNPVLAKQPRTSVSIPRYELLSTLQARNSIIPLPIPSPERIQQNDSVTHNFSNEQSTVISTTRQSKPTLPSQLITSSFPNYNQTPQETRKQENLQQQMPKQNASHIIRSNSSLNNKTVKDNTIVLSSSVIGLNDQQHFNNHSSSSLRRPPTLVKRNGKQFIIEFKERTERRYVQYND